MRLNGSAELGAMVGQDFERFAIEAVLAESNQVVVLVGPDMMIRWLSPSAEKYRLRAVGRSITDVIHPDDLARAAQSFDIAGELDTVETSLMAHAIVSLRIVTDDRVVPCEASGRWMKDDAGDWWLVAILHDVTTRYATDMAMRKLASGATELESIEALIEASHDYGGVLGAQLVWCLNEGELRTFGDLGSQVEPVFAALGDLAAVAAAAAAFAPPDGDWGYLIPVIAGSERLGVLALWGIGHQPDPEFASAAVTPLMDLAALAIVRGREHEELERRATTDLVTGLLNRHAFFSELETVGPSCLVMYIDLDAFKQVNDQYGHTLGDRLLSLIGNRLRQTVGDAAIVGRIGGDEFAVIARPISATEAPILSAQVVDALNHEFSIEGHHVRAAASVGAAYSHDAVDGRLLLDRADQALLSVKAQGKASSVVDFVTRTDSR